MHNSAQFRADDNEVGVNAKLKGAKTGRFKPPPWPEFLGPFIAGAALPQEGTDKTTDQPHLDQISDGTSPPACDRNSRMPFFLTAD